MAVQRYAFDLLNVENKDIERTFLCDLSILLTERTCGGVSGILKRLFFPFFLSFNILINQRK